MHSRILVPLDGSKVAEQVLPHARFFARALHIPVDLLSVVDIEGLTALADPSHGRPIDTVLGERMHDREVYLETVGGSFSGESVTCVVERGKPEEVIIEKAAAGDGTLIAMATHGRSGIQRWLLGSVAEKVLHGASNHLLLVRASEGGRTDGEAILKTVVIPLDGSELAEGVISHAVELTKKMTLDVILLRAYALPPSVTVDDYGTYEQDLMGLLEAEAKDYLEEQVKLLKAKGIERISSVVDFGYGAEKIIAFARKTPNNFIAMCTHGRSGIKRWALGSITERVVQHSGDPVLIIRAKS